MTEVVIECQGLTKRYGRTVAVNALTLSLRAGEPIALIGPNGAGKTSFLSLVCGFTFPASGSVRVLGHTPGSRALVGRVSALPQDAQFDPDFPVDRQLHHYARLQGMSAQQARDDVARVLGLVQLSDVGRYKPGALSHGMHKRVAMAQALLGTPELILLDEPTAGIDPPNVKILRDLIRAMATRATFIISSHNLDELERLCGSVVYLNHGLLVHAGPIAAESDSGFLTLGLRAVPHDAFLSACAAVPGVLEIQRRAQGDYLIRSTPGMPVDQALLALLADRGWKYRHLINGRSLEEQLYGGDALTGVAGN